MMPLADPEAAAKFASALSTERDAMRAIDQVLEAALTELGAQPDLAFAFFSADHEDGDLIANRLSTGLQTQCFLGCSGESIVGRGQEVEQQPAIALWLAKLPAARLLPMRLTFQRTTDGGTILGWPDELMDDWPGSATLILLGDPFSFPADAMIEQLNAEHPGTQVIGGMASTAAAPGENSLLKGADCFSDGAVAVLIDKGVTVHSVVSQGCRPIGNRFVVTKAEQNVIQELGGKPALIQLKAVFDELPTHEQAAVQSGLHVGRVVSEYQDSYHQGDFLVRNVVGVDPDDGSIAVGDYLRVGQTVQFHIRDPASADAEMRQFLGGFSQGETAGRRGALLFTCNGRGTRMFDVADHDAQVIHDSLGPIPLAGFFAAGELGPVAGQNFMHGFTASIALFEVDS